MQFLFLFNVPISVQQNTKVLKPIHMRIVIK